jgi:hypothetical protein
MAACGYIKADGERCKAQPMRGEGYCYAHHPDLEERRTAASRRGGKTGGRGRAKPGKGDIKDVKSWLLDLARRVETGQLEAKDGTAVSQILNIWLRGIETERKLKEQEELEERLESLERVLKERSKAG